MTCLILGNNLYVCDLLQKTASSAAYLELTGTCADAFEASAFLQKRPVDLLLISDEIPGITGLDFLKSLFAPPLAILIASTPDHAAEAFDLMVADYLVKPFNSARFAAALQRAKEIFEGRGVPNKKVEKDAIFVRSGNALLKIRFDEILWVQALGDYVVFQLEERKYTVHTTLRLVEERLPSEKFFRIHRSYIVALEKVESVEEGCRVILNNQPLPVSERFRTGLLEQLNLL